MRKTLIAIGYLAAAGLAAAAAPAAAQGFGQVAIQAAPPDPPPAAAAKPGSVSGVTVNGQKTAEKGKDPNEVVCHSTTPIGSRFPVKTCARRGDLAVQTEEGQTTTRQMTALRPGSSN